MSCQGAISNMVKLMKNSGIYCCQEMNTQVFVQSKFSLVFNVEGNSFKLMMSESNWLNSGNLLIKLTSSNMSLTLFFYI